MRKHLIASLLSAGLALFNLYFYIQRHTGTYLILFIIWLLVAYRNIKQYKRKKSKNS